MSKIFSDEQLKAIEAGGENYLISAGAGSGKTTVLTERIYRLAKKEQSLDCFLVLTFTNLAANEMKERVRKLLNDDDATKELASEVDNSHIETFDSFSLFLVKKYFYILGISSNPNIVDSSILTIKRKQYLDELCDEMYQKHDEEFEKLIYSYSIKNDNSIKNFIISLLVETDRKGDKYQFLRELKDDYFTDKKAEEAIEDYYKELLENISFVKKNAAKLCDESDADQIISYMETLEEAEDYDTLYQLLKVAKFPTKPRGETEDAEFRKSIANFFNKNIKIKDRGYGSSDDIKRTYRNLKPYASKIIDIALQVESRLDLFKAQYNAYSFGDISRLVLKLLKNEEIRKEISSIFKYIMVDEYQDTNDIQETVVGAIAKNNVYMVGDVKQSIYRFRGADCHIFQEKYEKYKKGIGGKEIDLNRSYRSRKEVVDFVNEVFEQIMTKEINSIDYSNGHRFEFGRKSYENNKPACSYQPEVYKYTYEKSANTPKMEAEIIARDILTRKNEGYTIIDDNGEHHSVDFKDFAIIIDRSTSFDVYRRVFSEYNIPLKVEAKDSMFKSEVVSMVKSLVKLLYYSLNNDYKSEEYRHAYFSVARSFLFEYPDDVLYRIYKDGTYLLEEFAQKLELIKEKLRYASIKQILITLYKEFDIYSAICKITQYYSNVHKLENFINIATNMDALNYSLEDFVLYFDDLMEQDIDAEYKDSDSQENSVTLLTIHGSKGLEYRVIYFPGFDKQFNRQEIKSSYLISNRYGLVLPSAEEEEISSLFIHLTKEEVKRADFEEKIRLLYVAITRAKEKIIILNGCKENDTNIIKPVDAMCMRDILKITNVLTKYETSTGKTSFIHKPHINEPVVKKVELKTLQIPAKIVEKGRASKELSEDIDESLLDFGTLVHSYLEHMDLENDDLSYIKDSNIRRYVRNVKESWIFKGVKNSQVRHEFRYFDEENNMQCFIDALIIKDDEIDIVDFKLKNIDEKDYDKQLRTYKRYVSKNTTLPVKMYLLAAITGEIREVYDE